MNNKLKAYKTFVEKELIPLEPLLINHKYDELYSELDEKRNQIKKLNLWTPYLPKKYGGQDMKFLDFLSVSEILGRSLLGHYAFNCQAPDIGNIELILRFGDDNQKKEFLEPLISGDIRSCVGMVEPERPGSNPSWLETSAVQDNGYYVINGRKWFTSSADGATFCILMAITNPEVENKYKRASMIIVPLNAKGVELKRNISVMGEEGAGFFSHAEIQYTNVRVPIENIIQNEGDGFRLAQERLGPGRIHHCMRWLGICERAFDLMCQRAVARKITPNDTLSNMALVKSWISESRVEIDSARLLVMECARKIDIEGISNSRAQISMIKFHTAKILENVLDRAIQTYGAMGITDDTPLAMWYRHERGARIYDGPDEVHKLAAAKHILKAYESKD